MVSQYTMNHVQIQSVSTGSNVCHGLFTGTVWLMLGILSYRVPGGTDL